jgi:putative ABC transport system substrate-binding protein
VAEHFVEPDAGASTVLRRARRAPLDVIVGATTGEMRFRREAPFEGEPNMSRVRRRDFVIAAGALLAAPFDTGAQKPARIARIGFLAVDLAGNPRGMEPFRQGLRDLGYLEGQNVVIEIRDAERRLERLPSLAAELVALKVDAIVAPAVVAAQAALKASTVMPIVFAGVADPVSDGLVASLARPGGNVTGLSNLSPELISKRLELLKQAIPEVNRVAVLWQPGSGMEGTDRDALKQAEVAARALGVQLQVVEARAPADLDRAFSDMIRDRAEALTVVGTPMFFTERRRLVGLAGRHRLPSMYTSRQFVDAGGLMAYGANLDDLLRRTAVYVDKILKGANPGDLPVEQPTKFELIINIKTAKALGITIPKSLLGRADEVIH